jgi:predicted DNA-binding protein
MAKKKKPTKPAKQDQGGNFMVRLPDEYKEKLEKVIARTKRSFTAEVQVALDKHFKDEPPE